MHRLLVLFFAFALGAGCGGSPSTPSTTVSSIQIVGLQTFTAIGIRATYTATATMANGATQDVSGYAVWASSDPSLLSMTPAGLATFLATGGPVEITATYRGVTGHLPITLAISKEDCSAYDPSTLFVALTGGAYLITDGRERFFQLDTESDATNALALMRSYNTSCFIGRNNSRPNRNAYIVDYWKGPGPAPTFAAEDCQAFNSATLRIGATVDGWTLSDASAQIALLDSQADVDLLFSVAKQYSARCFIGRGNQRPDPLNFVFQYWK